MYPSGTSVRRAVSLVAAAALALGSAIVLTSTPAVAAVALSGDVSISGTPAPGRTVTANPTGWESDVLFDYSWSRGGTSTGVTTRNIKLPDDATVGEVFRVTVTGHKEGFDDGAQTASVEVVATVPNAPTDLTATVSGRSVALSWQAPTNTGGLPLLTYRVDYRPASGGAWTTFAHPASTATSLTVADLQGATDYLFRVAASSAQGDSLPTLSVAAASGPPDLPGAVSTPVAVAGNYRATLTWDPPANAAGAAAPVSYKIECYRYGGTTNSNAPGYPRREWVLCGNGDAGVLKPNAAGKISYIVTGLPRYSFNFRVTPVNAAGDGATSAQSNRVTPTASRPSAPRTFRAAIASDGMSVTFTWRNPSNLRGNKLAYYEFVWNGNGSYGPFPGAENSRVVDDGTTANMRLVWTGYSESGSDSPLGKNSRVRVRACAEVPEEAAALCSGWTSVRVRMGTPRAPTNLVLTGHDTQIYASWTAPVISGSYGPAAYYQVQYRDRSSSTWINAPDAFSNHTAFTIPNLTNQTANNGAYQVQVRAVGFNGRTSGWLTSSSSNRINTTVGGGMAADNPTDVVATAGVERVVLTWTAPAVTADQPAATDYVIERSSSATGPWAVVRHPASTDTTATVTGLDSDRQYYFRVRSLNSNGVSSGVAVGPITPEAAQLPGAPIDVKAAGQDTAVSLTWTKPADGGAVITAYEIEYRELGALDWVPVESDDGDDEGEEDEDCEDEDCDVEIEAPAEYTVTGLDNDTRYEFRVAAVNHVGMGPWSDIVRGQPGLTADKPTDVKAVAGDTQVALSWESPLDTGTQPIVGWEISYRPQTDNADAPWSVMVVDSNPNLGTVTGLTNGTVYDFEVAALTYVGRGIPGLVSAMPYAGGPQACQAPSGLVATPGNTMVGLTWNAPADAATCGLVDYRVEYRLATDDYWTIWDEAAEATTLTRDTVKDLVNDQLYQFRVIALNLFGDVLASSPPSNVAEATPRADLAEVPYPPQDLWPEPGPASVTLNWSAPTWDGGSPVTDYVIVYREKGAYFFAEYVDGQSTALQAVVNGLDPTKIYEFKVAAVNAIGISDFTDVVTAQPLPETDPPTNLQATPGNALVSLSWTAPATVDSPVLQYQVAYQAAGATSWTVVLTGSTLERETVVNLTNGTEYSFKVAAVTADGAGRYSDLVQATPDASLGSVPSAPVLTATPGNTQVGLSWTIPASNDASAVSHYFIRYRAAGQATWTTLVETDSNGAFYTIRGLTNGTTYQFTVAALNGVGLGAWSNQAEATPDASLGQVQGAPTDLAAVAGDAQVALTWRAPVGGDPALFYVVDYRVQGTSLWQEVRTASADPAFTVTGLTNGVTYEFKVASVNPIGLGDWSGLATATPVETVIVVPDAPTDLAATAGDAQVALTWTAPASDGGTAVTGYSVQYRAQGAAVWQSQAAVATNATVTGLTNDTTYEFQVAAVNAVGQGEWSNLVQATPTSGIVLVPPGPPTGLAATAGDAQVTLAWTAPVSDGGTPLTGYSVGYRAVGQTTWQTTTVTDTTTIIASLTNGVAYEFRLAAVNAIGTSVWSAPVQATPNGLLPGSPSQPLNLAAVAGDSEVGLSWAAPANGAPILAYVVAHKAAADSDWTIVQTDSPLTRATVQSLTNGVTYDFKLAAVNAIGQGQWSDTVQAVPDASAGRTPSAPLALTATAGDAEVGLSWTAPATGAPILGYAVAYKPVGETRWLTFETDSALTLATVRNLTNGVAYNFKLAAINAIGLGAWSATVQATPQAGLPQTPQAPPSLTATAGDTQVGLTWTTPADGGSAITAYVVWHRAKGQTAWQVQNTGTPLTAFTVTGLTNGVTYEFKVAAVNGIGLGLESAVVEATPTLGAGQAPVAATSLTASAGDTQVGLAWSYSGPAATHWVVAYKATADAVWQLVQTDSPLQRATISDLTNGVVYEFKVAGFNAIGVGPWSNTVQATPDASAGRAPSAPINLTATPGDAQIGLNWSAPISGAPIQHYAVAYQAVGATEWVAFETDTALPRATVSGLANSVAYNFKVAAINAIGVGPWSNTVQAMPDGSGTVGQVPSAPLGLEATAGNAEAGLAWSAPVKGAPILGYAVAYQVAGETDWESFETDSALTLATVRGLTNAVTYNFKVAAINAVGLGEWSNVAQATPDASLARTPQAPGVAAVAGDTQVGLTWTTPDNGGSAITSYVVWHRAKGQTAWQVQTTDTPLAAFTVTGLTNGVTYEFKVAAVNGIGLGLVSAVVEATPTLGAGQAPNAATSLTASAGDTQVGLSWSYSGPAVTHWVVAYKATTASAWQIVETDSPMQRATVSGLTNGVVYEFKVAGFNAIGVGPWSNTAQATPDASGGHTPSAPGSLTATPGDGEVGLSWSAPDSTVTKYVVAYQEAGQTTWTVVETDSALTMETIRDLANGTEYNFKVAAVNDVGVGPWSDTVSTAPQVGLAKTPQAPPTLTATAGDTQVGLAWTTPNNGGAAISHYIVWYRVQGAATWQNTATDTPLTAFTVTGLTNGVTYEFKVAGVNAIGLGLASQPVTATPTANAGRAPNAPIGLAVTPGDTQVGLAWGYSGPTVDYWTVAYKVAADSIWQIVTTDSSLQRDTITGLTNGTTYDFKVAGFDAIGVGPWSETVQATPQTGLGQAPSAPLSLTATPGDSQVGLSWSEPQSGEPILGYAVAYRAAGQTNWKAAETDSALTLATVRGLTNGTAYEFKVAAINAIGVGPWSNIVQATPEAGLAQTPAAPPTVTATAGDSQVGLSWVAPNDGGAAISHYVIWYRAQNTAVWQLTATDTPLTAYTVTGLVNGTTYEFRLAAVNAIGLGLASQPVTATPQAGAGQAPGAPTGLTATAGNTEVGLNWTAPAAGSHPVTAYVVAYQPVGGSIWTVVNTASDLTWTTVRGLTNGTAYQFKVAAVNAIGVGPWSAPAQATPSATAAKTPAAPLDLTATPGNAVVGLSWTAPADNGSAVVNYAVFHRPVGQTTWTSQLTGSDATAHTVTGLTNGVTYELKVAALNGIGLGLESSVVQAMPQASLAGVPAAPADVKTTPGNQFVVVAWQPPADDGGSAVIDYLVEYRPVGAATWTSATADTTSLKVDQLVNGTPYEFQVTARNAIGLGQPSQTVQATPTYGPTITLSDTAVKIGQTLTITGAGFNPGELIESEIRSQTAAVGVQTATANGGVVFTWTVPADFSLGAHQAILIDAAGLEFAAVFTVLPADIPATGAGASEAALYSGALVTLLGATCLLMAYRRREQPLLGRRALG
ncbi:MAG: fibronectin type III domain-containing protein [Propionibacteriaceae bacterium]|jgi:titin|nr:fibronectin type III domain-containing protein [Propionibacteriaceae bacterium]